MRRVALAICGLFLATTVLALPAGPRYPDVSTGVSPVTSAGGGGPIPFPGMILVDYSYAWPNAKAGIADTNVDRQCPFSTTGTYNIVESGTCAGASDCVTGQNWTAAGFVLGSVVTLFNFPSVDGTYTVDAVSTTELGLGTTALTAESGNGDELVGSIAIEDGICLSESPVQDDSGDAGDAFWKRAIFPAASCDYVSAGSGFDAITCVLGSAADHTINTFHCREDVPPYPACPDELASVGYCVGTSTAAPQRAAPVVFYDPNIDRYINLEGISQANSICQGIGPAFSAGAFFLRDARYSSNIPDLTGFEYAPALSDAEHFSRMGFLAMADWLARSAKWEFMFYPPDSYNLVENGRAETDCTASGDWGTFDAGTAGGGTLASTTFDHTASNLAFMGNACSITAGTRNDAGDALVIGPMDGLQRGVNDSGGANGDQYYACHMVISGDNEASDSNHRNVAIEIVDSDTSTKMTMLAEGSDPSHDGTNHFKVWSNHPPGAAETDGWTFWSGAGTTQATRITPSAASAQSAGTAQPIVITFEVESCDETAFDTCPEDDSGEEFEIRLWHTVAGAAVWADEVYCYPTNFGSNPLNLHDIFPNTISASFWGASNLFEATTCTPGDNCEKWSWAIKERFPVFGKTIVPSGRREKLHAVNNDRLANKIYSDATGDDYETKIVADATDYIFMNLGQNDMDSSFPRTANEIFRDLTAIRGITARHGKVLIWLADPQTVGNTTQACSGLGSETCGELWEDLLIKLINSDVQSTYGGVRLPVP